MFAIQSVGFGSAAPPPNLTFGTIPTLSKGLSALEHTRRTKKWPRPKTGPDSSFPPRSPRWRSRPLHSQARLTCNCLPSTTRSSSACSASRSWAPRSCMRVLWSRWSEPYSESSSTSKWTRSRCIRPCATFPTSSGKPARVTSRSRASSWRSCGS